MSRGHLYNCFGRAECRRTMQTFVPWLELNELIELNQKSKSVGLMADKLALEEGKEE